MGQGLGKKQGWGKLWASGVWTRFGQGLGKIDAISVVFCTYRFPKFISGLYHLSPASITKALGICNTGNFWEISDEVLNRIEGVNYLENKLKHNTYLKDNPIVAQRKFINIH